MIYLLTAIGLTPDGSSTVHIYTQTLHRTTKNKQYIEQHKKQYIPVLRLSPVSIIPPTLHTQLHLHVSLTRRTDRRSLGTFRMSGSIGYKNYSSWTILILCWHWTLQMVPTVQVLRLDLCVHFESFQYIMLPCVSCQPDNLATYSLFSQLGKERAECHSLTHSLALLFSGVDFAVGGHVLCAWGGWVKLHCLWLCIGCHLLVPWWNMQVGLQRNVVGCFVSECTERIWIKFGMVDIRIHRELDRHRFGINISSFSASKSSRSVQVTTCIEDASGFVSTPSSV
jgi:hypothetical protein